MKVMTVEKSTALICLVAAITMVVPIFSSHFYVVLAAFLAFEACVGASFSAMSTLRSPPRYQSSPLSPPIAHAFPEPLLSSLQCGLQCAGNVLFANRVVVTALLLVARNRAAGWRIKVSICQLSPLHVRLPVRARVHAVHAHARRSHLLPDHLQASIMNVFRLPLNVLVVTGTTVGDMLPAWQVLSRTSHQP